MERPVRKIWAAVLALVLIGTGACGNGTAPGASGAPAKVAADVGLSPAGTPLAAGLVVPVWAELVGPVFPRVPDPTEPVTSHAAVLNINGDPFAAWDDMARQTKALGVQIPGSGICWWQHNLSGVGPIQPGASVASPRPESADAMDCSAGARAPRSDGNQVTVQMRLWWWAAGAELHLQILEGDMNEPPFSFPEIDPGSAPASSVARLPERDDPTRPEIGDPFGRENNCFEAGYDRLTVPAGARLVGGGTTPSHSDFAAVLAVVDAQAVLRELRSQLDDPQNPEGTYDLGQEQLPDGTPVWSLSGTVSAGGGGCTMWSSPEGDAVLVMTASD